MYSFIRIFSYSFRAQDVKAYNRDDMTLTIRFYDATEESFEFDSVDECSDAVETLDNQFQTHVIIK